MDIQSYKALDNWISADKLVKEIVLSKEEIHAKGLLHLSTHLLVINNKDEILCRKRSETDIRYSGLWTTTIGTHVPLNQDYEQILKEYFPLTKELRWIGEFRVHDENENEVNGLCVVNLTDEILDDEFMKNRRYLGQQELIKLVGDGKTTPHLAGAFKLFLEKVE